MSLLGSAARSTFLYTGDMDLDGIQQAKNELAAKVDANPLSNAIEIVGLLQTDGSTTDGIEFAIGQSRELAHGLGRHHLGFAIIGCKTGPQMIYEVPVTTGLENTHIKLTHSASAGDATSVRVAIY